MGIEIVELVMAFEEEFEIDIPNEAAENLLTIGDVVDFIVADLDRHDRPADPQEVFERVRRITVDNINVHPDQVTRNARFIEDLSMD